MPTGPHFIVKSALPFLVLAFALVSGGCALPLAGLAPLLMFVQNAPTNPAPNAPVAAPVTPAPPNTPAATPAKPAALVASDG